MLPEEEGESNHSQNGQEKEAISPRPSPTIPNLVTPSGTALTPYQKAEALKSGFFPPIPSADLTDIPIASYPAEMPSPMSISE